MSVQDREAAVAQLSAEDLAIVRGAANEPCAAATINEIADWFAEYHAKARGEQIERDFEAGRRDSLLRQVDEEYDAGKAKPL